MWVQDYQLQLVPQHAARAAARPADRLLPAHPVPAGRAVPAAARGGARSSRACSAPTWSASSCPGGAANFVRLVRQRVGHKTHRDLVYLPDGRTVRAAAFPISIDSAGFEELAQSDGGRRAGRRDPRATSATRRKVFLGVDRLDYTKGIYARLRAFGELIRDGELERRGRRLRAGRDAVARAGRAVPRAARRHRPAGRPDQRRPRPDRPARRSATCTRRTRARRWPRSTAPPTSWWSRRSATA